MRSSELADWLAARGWTVAAVLPAVVTVHRGTSRRVYARVGGVWVIAFRRGKRNWPGSRADDERKETW